MKNFLVGLFLFFFTLVVHGEEIKEVPVVTIQTNFGPIEVELNPSKSPESVENFLAYVQEGFYEGTIFHRVIDSFVVQGGGYTVDFKKKNTHDAIPNEAANGLKNVRGTVAMARTSEPHSATSQFFFNVKDNKFLDYKSSTPSGFGYTVFGKVVEGMDVVDKISKLPTDADGPFRRDVPQTPVIIEAVKVGYAPPTKWVIAAPEKSPAADKKKDKPAMPSMMEMQQDMLSDLDTSEEDTGDTKDGAVTPAKTDSAAEEKVASPAAGEQVKEENADKADQQADKESDVSESSATSEKDQASEDTEASSKADASTSETADQAASDSEDQEDTKGKLSKPSEGDKGDKDVTDATEAKGEEAKDSTDTTKAGESGQDAKEEKSASADKGADEESEAGLDAEKTATKDEAVVTPKSAGKAETAAVKETPVTKGEVTKSPPASAAPSVSTKPPKSPEPEEAVDAGKGADETATDEETAADNETAVADDKGETEKAAKKVDTGATANKSAPAAEKSEVTRSAMAVSNATARVDPDEEEKSTDKTAKMVTPKPAAKTPPPGAKPPDSPTSPDKPEPPAN